MPGNSQNRPTSEFVTLGSKAPNENLAQISGQKLLPGRQANDVKGLNSPAAFLSKAPNGDTVDSSSKAVFKEPTPVTDGSKTSLKPEGNKADVPPKSPASCKHIVVRCTCIRIERSWEEFRIVFHFC